MKLWSSKTKLLCETSFKNEALKIKKEAFLRDSFKNEVLKIKNEAFVRDFLQNEALKINNEAFLRDVLQKWSFEAQKRSFSARLPSKMKLWRSKTKLLCETSFKNDMLTGHLTSEFQYVLTIFKWMLQKYCACHEKVEPRHTKSCNCHAKWSLQSNTSVTWKLQPSTDSASEASNIDIAKHEILAPATRNASFRSLFKSTTSANVFATLTNSCACHAFWNVSKSLRLPRDKHFEPQKVVRAPGGLTILASKSFSRAGVVQILATSTSKSAPTLSVLNDFDFQIVLARRRGANFAASSAADPPRPPVLRSWLSQPAKPQNYGKTQHFAHFLPAKSSCLTSLLYHICAITSLGWQIFSSNFQYSRKLDS